MKPFHTDLQQSQGSKMTSTVLIEKLLISMLPAPCQQHLDAYHQNCFENLSKIKFLVIKDIKNIRHNMIIERTQDLESEDLFESLLSAYKQYDLG